jgi:hypothetical protein
LNVNNALLNALNVITISTLVWVGSRETSLKAKMIVMMLTKSQTHPQNEPTNMKTLVELKQDVEDKLIELEEARECGDMDAALDIALELEDLNLELLERIAEELAYN